MQQIATPLFSPARRPARRIRTIRKTRTTPRIAAAGGCAATVAWAFLAAAILAGGAPAPAAAAPAFVAALPVAQAAGPGQAVKAPDMVSDAELFRFEPELVPSLLRLAPGDSTRVAGWPVAPGSRRDVVITRHEVYAANARVLEVTDEGTRELPRSQMVFFWGSLADDPLSAVVVTIDPAAGTVEGMVRSAGVAMEWKPLVPGKPGLHLLASAKAFLNAAAAGHSLSWKCGEETLVPLPGTAAAAESNSAPRAQQAATNGTGFDLATVAVDTDHQLLSLKFANSTTDATNYIASMFATINVMYERDLNVELLVGDTILRTSAASDPYTQQPDPSSGAAAANQLNEFTNYWSANYANVPRALASMLSGKSTNAFEASGIAWVGGLCDFSLGYNFNQLFTFTESVYEDTIILGHEIGHNFGTRHTHCYSPPIDECYNLESGCYNGPTSCPAPSTINGVTGVIGTIMSYCHLLSGCSTTEVFHPRVVAVLNPNIQTALGVCITPQNTGPSVSSISPKAGSTAGGTAVTLTGSNFQSGATVTLGGVAATGVTVVNSNTITATTGAHATGAVDVVVTSGTTATLSKGFFYAPPPVASRFHTVTPCRVLDTRNATGTYGGPALGASQIRLFKLTGQCGVPTGATAVSVNVTAIGAGGAGFLSLFPGNAIAFGTSNLSFNAGQTRASNSILELATDGSGTFAVLNGAAGGTQFLLDVNGYFQ